MKQINKWNNSDRKTRYTNRDGLTGAGCCIASTASFFFNQSVNQSIVIINLKTC